jgi:hypothetical protein
MKRREEKSCLVPFNESENNLEKGENISDKIERPEMKRSYE